MVISEDSGTDIVGVSTAGSLDLDSAAAISDAGATSVDVTLLADVAGTSISLGGGTFNAGTLTFNSAGAVVISEDSGTDIVGVNMGESLDLDSTAAISDAGVTSIEVTMLADVTGTSISLGDGTFNAGTLTFTATGAVLISEDSDTELTGTSTAATAALNSSGTVIDGTAGEGAGSENIIAATVTLNATTGVGNGTGVLDEAADIDLNAGTLNVSNSTSGSVQVFEVDSAALGTVTNPGRAVVIDAAAAITDGLAGEGTGSENVTGESLSIRADSGIGSADDLDTSVDRLDVINTTSHDVNVTDVSGLILTDLNGSTSAVDAGNSGGSIVATGPLTISSDATIGTSFSFTASDDASDGAGAEDDLTLSAGIVVTAGAVHTYNAGDNFSLPATTTVTSTGVITINADIPNADAGSGSTVDILGSISGTAVNVNTAVDADRVNLDLSTSSGAVAVNTSDGADTADVRATAAATPTTVNAGADNDMVLLASLTLDLDSIKGTVAVNSGTNTAGVMRTRVDDLRVTLGSATDPEVDPILDALECGAQVHEITESVEIGDEVMLFDSSSTLENKYMLAATSLIAANPRDFAGVTMAAEETETFMLMGGTQNDHTEVQVSAATALPQVVVFDGGAGSDDFLDVIGSTSVDLLAFDDMQTNAGTRSPFEVENVARFRAQGGAGNDDVYNKTSNVKGVLEGDEANDVLVNGPVVAGNVVPGAEDSYVLGGADADFLFGASYNVIYLPDHALNATGQLILTPSDGDRIIIDPGTGTGGTGTQVISTGTDIVCSANCVGSSFFLSSDGATIDVCAWLVAIWVPFQGGSIGGGLGVSPEVEDGVEDCAKPPVNWNLLFRDIDLTTGGDDSNNPTEFSLLTEADLTAAVDEAIARWRLTDISLESATRLDSIVAIIANLPPGELGRNAGTNIIIDNDAAGFGWFVDDTPSGDEEFTRVTDVELTGASGDAASYFDLLTVVMHEVGHVIRHSDIPHGGEPGQLMSSSLSTGIRRLPPPAVNEGAGPDPVWQNSENPLDINDDGIVTPRDVLVGINALNDGDIVGANGHLPEARPQDDSAPFFDVNGDDLFTPVDLLQVINELNLQVAEGESGTGGDSAIPMSIAAYGLLATDQRFAVIEQDQRPARTISSDASTILSTNHDPSERYVRGTIRSVNALSSRFVGRYDIQTEDDSLESILDEIAGDILEHEKEAK